MKARRDDRTLTTATHRRIRMRSAHTAVRQRGAASGRKSSAIEHATKR